MNLALRDVRHRLGRFLLTAAGIGTLLMVVMGMGGIYRGLVEEATLLVDRSGADLWVVQRDTRGPFAEISRLPRSVEDRVLTVPGVESSRSFVSHTIQRMRDGKPLRITIQGLSWPEDRGAWLPIAAGQPIFRGHYQMVADSSSGLRVGDRVPLGKETFEVVGLTRRMVSSSGDPMAFLTIADAVSIQYDRSGEGIRGERTARVARLADVDLHRTQPQTESRAAGPSSGLPALGVTTVSAVLVDVRPGFDAAAVGEQIGAWPDVSVYSRHEQRELLLHGSVDRARRQIGLFTVLLVVVSGVIMALILYTLTLDKIHDIAMLKLMGARNSVILGLIVQQAILLGALGLCLGWVLGQWIFPHFPRRVVVVEEDVVRLSVIVLAISLAASALGIGKALRVAPNEVLS